MSCCLPAVHTAFTHILLHLLLAGVLHGTSVLRLLAFLQYENHKYAQLWQRAMLGTFCHPAQWVCSLTLHESEKNWQKQCAGNRRHRSLPRYLVAEHLLLDACDWRDLAMDLVVMLELVCLKDSLYEERMM